MIRMNVDAALAEVPVNLVPLTDDTDFKSIEASVAYNAAGMALYWHFVTVGGAYSCTAVTPTTGGTYDWAHQGQGMYSIEIPASGGASINNDTEGYGWFTGFATGVLPWRGPTIQFSPAILNSADVVGDEFRRVDVRQFVGGNATASSGRPEVNTTHWNGTALSTTNPLPNAAPGASGGLLIAGSNAAATLASLTVTGALTISDGIIVTVSTTNRSGFSVTGNGSGHAVSLTGGATGAGFRSRGGASSGSAVDLATATSSPVMLLYAAGDAQAIYAYADGNDAVYLDSASGYGALIVGATAAVHIGGQYFTSDGLQVQGGSISGTAIEVVGEGDVVTITSTGGNGNAVVLTGDGTGVGLLVDGEALATQSSVDTIDGIVDAILVDTGTTLQAELDGIQADTEDIQSRLPAALVSGRIDASVGAMASGVLTATAIAADAITAAKVAADVHQETIELAFTYNATADYAGATAGSLVKEIADNAGGSALTAADIADAVWDELIAGHAISGSTGEALSAAGGAGDPWITALPGSYTAGQAGYILGTNLNATVSSRSTQSSVDTIDGIVDAILVDTGTTLQAELDGIQADTEDIQSRLPAALVAGRIDASVGAMAANVMTASALASDAVTEIQSGLATASALSTLQTSVNDIPTNAELATALAAADDAVLAALGVVDGVVDAIKVVTDQFVFGVTGVVNANITHVNETLVGGTGALGDEWGPG